MSKAMTTEQIAEFKAAATAHNAAVKVSLLDRLTVIRAEVVSLINDAQRLLVADDPQVMTLRDVTATASQNYLANLDQVIIPIVTPHSAEE